MNNPFSILRLVLKSKRPSHIREMKAVRDSFWLRPGYTALTFFGYIVTSTQHEADIINQRYDGLKNHEMIHLRQAQDCHDSWTMFYLRYVWYYLRALPYNRKKRNAAYWMNPFEMEAYEHMYEPDYLEKCANGANGWRAYAKMKPSERRKMSKS